MKNMLINTVAIILATGMVMAGMLALVNYPDADSDRTVSVQGEAMRTVAADEAELRFAVVTEDEDSSAAASANAAQMERIIAALQGYGEVETEGYSLQPVYDYGRYDTVERDLKIQFYRASNTVVLKTTDLGVIGEAIDAATAAGANRVQGLSFQLSDEARSALRQELLAEAAGNAREKADGIAQGLGVEVDDVKTVSEGSVYFPYARGAVMYDMAETAAPKTPVEPGTLDVQASVSVTYTLD